jgi:CDP-glycerol glycerophosphotransferase (TagB/SpsB family)
MARGALEAVVPATKLLVYGDNLDFFRSLDVLVVAEKTSLILKSRHGLKDLKIVHTRHGAGDRAIGFDKASACFDHVLVSGRKIRDRLIAEAGVDPTTISVVGYPKFDFAPRAPRVHPLVDDGRPVVLYNPHVSPHLSSWYSAGRQVLDWFAEHDDHHLIFAPHVMLFERPFVVTVDRLRIDRPGHIDERYLRAPNIHFDLGSRASTTMAYTQRADVYLGDVSSQVYEFLLRPRPCVFLNPQKLAWRGDPNFAHWDAGPVIEEVAQLGEALAAARADHATIYASRQRRLFDYSFDLTDEPSSVRAARALAAFAGLEAHGLEPAASLPRAAQG